MFLIATRDRTILKRLFIYSLILACSPWIVWQFMTDEEKTNMLANIRRDITDDGKHVPVALDTVFGRVDIKWVWERYWPEILDVPEPVVFTKPQQLPVIKYEHRISICDKPETEKITNKRVVYEWKNNKGKTQFGDRPPSSNYKDLKIRNLKTSNFFTLNTDTRFGQLPAYTKDRVRFGVTQTYKTLANVIDVAQLQKVTLNMTFYGDYDRFQDYRKQVAPRTSNNIGGFYSPRDNSITVLMHGDANNVINVAIHEATHAIVAGLYAGMPVWMNEGMAEFFEAMEYNTHQKKIFSLSRHHLQVLKNNNLPSLTEHFSQPPNIWYHPDNSNLNYAIDWSLIYFLMSSEEGRSFLRYLLNYFALNHCKPFDSIEYINANYPGGVTLLDRQWRNWLAEHKQDKLVFH